MTIFHVYARASFDGPQVHIVQAGSSQESSCRMYPETFRRVGTLEQPKHPTTKDIAEMWDAYLESQKFRTYTVLLSPVTRVPGLTFDQVKRVVRLLMGSIPEFNRTPDFDTYASAQREADFRGIVLLGSFSVQNAEQRRLYIEAERA